MHTLCRLSRRWHQQFHLSAKLVGHGPCLQEIYPVRYYARKTREPAGKAAIRSHSIDDIQVREYEQFGSDSKTRVAIDPKAEVKKERALIQSKLEELESELAVLRQGPFGPNSEFMQSLPVDEREKVLKALEDEGLCEEEDDLVDLEEVEKMLEDRNGDDQLQEGAKKAPGVTLRIPQRQKTYVKQFNKALEAATAARENLRTQLTLWKWYLRCQQHVPGFSSVIPEDIWQTLWLSQTTILRRPRYMVMLGKDMLAAEVTLSGPQWIEYIGAVEADGDTATAISVWEKHRASLGPDPEIAHDFWPLGVRLYAALGRPQKAQDVAFGCLDDRAVAEPQILVPVIAAWGQSQNPLAQQKAWTCYLKLKTLLGDQMTPEIYDSVSSSLLKANHAEMALAVFKDMVVAEERSSDDSAVVYKKAMNLVEDLHSQAVTEERINRISLTALMILPKSFHNKFFFGSWIKKLIGQGDVDAAVMVVELMFERGIKLDANHLNGIIGAWLREGSSTSRHKAERMAWSMIDARLEMVRRRNEKAEVPSLPPGLNKVSRQKIRAAFDHTPSFLRRAAPPANIETFSILLLHYTRRSDSATAAYLTHVMTGPGQIMPNAFIMNHWLYAALRSSDVQAVWQKYSSLKTDIASDLETFAALWDTAKVQYDRSRAAYAKEFPTARDLFAEMDTWLKKLSDRNLGRAKDNFSVELYNQIVRCFCLSSDLPGTLCCLHGLNQLFNQFPDDITTRMIMIQVARLLPADRGYQPSGIRGSRRKVSQQRNALSRVSGIIQTITDRHGLRLVEQGIVPEELDPQTDTAKQVRLDILTEFLLSVMARSKKVTEGVEQEVQTVAKGMGVDVGKVDFGCLKDIVI